MSLSSVPTLFVLIIPFIFVPNVFNPYELPKFILFVGGVEVLAAVFVLKCLVKKTFTLPRPDALTVSVLLFGAVNLISDILGLDPKISLLGSNVRYQGFITLFAGILLFLLMRYFSNPKSLSVFKKGIWITSFLISVFALWQIVQLKMLQSLIPTYNGRIVGTMGNPNFLAGYLVMLLPFVLWPSQEIKKSSLVRIIRLANVFTINLTIFFTDSRAAYLALVLLFLIYVLRLLPKLNIPRIAVWLSIILVFLGLFSFINMFMYKDTVLKDSIPTIKERGCPESWPQEYPWKIITDIHNNAPIFKREALCDNRLLIWIIGLESLSKQPLLGYGQDNFELAIPSGKMHLTDSAHNIFLEIAVSSGLIGLLLYIAAIFIAIKKASFPIKMSLLTFLIVAQFNPLSIAQISLFWFLLGITPIKTDWRR